MPTPRRSLLRVQAHREDGVLVMRLTGQLDIYTVASFRGRLEHVASSLALIVLDVQAVSLVDSSGLGALVSLRSACASRGVTLALVAADPHLRRALDITGLGDGFVHEATVEAAVQCSSQVGAQRAAWRAMSQPASTMRGRPVLGAGRDTRPTLALTEVSPGGSDERAAPTRTGEIAARREGHHGGALARSAVPA